jgi:hypothetical protein
MLVTVTVKESDPDPAGVMTLAGRGGPSLHNTHSLQNRFVVFFFRPTLPTTRRWVFQKMAGCKCPNLLAHDRVTYRFPLFLSFLSSLPS